MIIELELPPSINHCYFTTNKGQRLLTKEAKNWIDYAGYIALQGMNKQGWNYTTCEKIIMNLWVFWPDNRRRDMHNLHKLIADAFEKILYDDDRYLLMRDMDFIIDKDNPRIIIELEVYN